VEVVMRAAGGLLGVLLVAGIGLFIFKARFTSQDGAVASPTRQIDAAGVRATLLSIAQAERLHAATHGSFADIGDLQKKGFLSFSGNRLHGYHFRARLDGARRFTITATPLGQDSSDLPVLSIDQTLQISTR
jgi:hypothetical protein